MGSYIIPLITLLFLSFLSRGINGEVVNDNSILKRVQQLEQTQSKMVDYMKRQVRMTSKMEEYINETSLQFRMYIQYHGRFDNKLGMSFQDVLRLTSKNHTLDDDIVHLARLEYKYTKFREQYAKTWGITYDEVTRLSRRIDFHVNDPVPILEKLDYMYHIFVNGYKETWGIQFAELVKLTREVDFEINGSIPIINEIKSLFYGFEEIWGEGSFKLMVSEMTKGNEKDMLAIKASINRIKNMGNVLQFTPAQFKFENGKLLANGPVNIYHENGWRLIHWWYRTPRRHVHYFEDQEANVTCKTGGYASGKFILKGRYIRSHTQLWLERLDCGGSESSIYVCSPEEKFINANHRIGSNQIECYF